MDDSVQPARPRQRFLRFGLRSFFVFVTLIAFAAAWLGTEMAQRRQEKAVIAELTTRNSGGSTSVAVDSRFDTLSTSELNPLNPPSQREPADLLKKLQNLDMFRRVAMFSSFPKGNSFAFGRDDMGRLSIEREYKAGLTDADMQSVKKLANLRSLWLEAHGITDQGLVQLSSLTELEILWLQHTAVTDNGLSVLANFPKLRDLDLSGTFVTDASVDILEKCRQLKHLKLENTNVTPDGIAKLRQALPDCQIEN